MDAPFSCPNPQCSQRLSLASLPPGQKVRCPGCGTVFVVPSPTTDFSQSKGSVPAPPPSPPPSLPATIGPYQVRGKLGQGAFGVVYRAHDPAMERDVAIKMLNATAVKNQKYLDRFLREARVVGQMLHGNIVPVYQLGRLGQDYYIVSAFIPGRPLEAAVPEHGMDPPQAVRLVIQLLEALAYAHERGVFHRDVKPANAMLDDKGTLYLMDFGLAGLLDQDSHRMTQDGSVMGTPAYMAPEQAKGQVELVGPAADQYSAGMVLYELLTGRLAFEAPSLPALLYQVLEAPPPPPSRLRPGLDPALEALCLRTLAKTPQERFPGCREFADALKAWLAGGTSAAATVTGDAGTARRNRAAGQNTAAAPHNTLQASTRAAPDAGQRQTTPLTAQSTLNNPPVQAATRSPAPRHAPLPPPPPPPPPPAPRWRLWLIVGAVALPVILAIAFFVISSGGTKKGDEAKEGLRHKMLNP